MSQRDGEISIDSSRFWHSHRLWCWVIVLLWIGLNAALLARGGIREAADTSGYTHAASYYLNGAQGEPPSQTLRFGYTMALAASQRVGLGFAGMVALQLALATLALWCVYDFASELGGRSSGIVAALCAVSWGDVHRWHFFILTDSAYISTLAIALWAVHRAAHRKGWWYAVAAASLGATISVRPNSLFLPALATGYWAALSVPHLARGRRLALAALATLAVGAVCVATPFARRAIAHNASASDSHPSYRADGLGGSPEAMFRRGVVIWGQPSPLSEAAPREAAPASKGWASALGYATRHPVWVLRLACARVVTEAAAVRPFYSRSHNILLAALALPLWAGAVWGAWLLRRREGAVWIVGVVALHLALVGATWADYDGRWLAHLVLPLAILAGCGLHDLSRRILKIASR